MYWSCVIHMFLNVGNEARILAPIQVDIFRAGGAWIRILSSCEPRPDWLSRLAQQAAMGMAAARVGNTQGDERDGPAAGLAA